MKKTLEDHFKFQLVREIAEGGMGSIFEAQQYGAEGFEKTMAIKTILEEFSSDTEFVEMFIGEAKLVADLVHQNIVQIYQLGKIGKQYYIAMEYINGINLEQFVDRHFEKRKRIPVNLATFIVSRLCRGLEYAHQKTDKTGKPLGVVHRDVSPKNVMLTWEGVVKLTDFGIAKAAHFFRNREGEILMGKVQYMSPEQAAYKGTDQRSDIFSLGIVLYEVLSGRSLFAHEDTDVTLDNVTRMPIPPIEEYNPDVPEDLKKILNRALERDLDKRYPDAGKMGYDLEYFMYHDRFGPTNVTLEKYLRQLFPEGYAKSPPIDPGDDLSFNPDTIIIKNDDLV
ncbi:MAG: serine/threonine protein kinase [Planctomycetota bacterium]|jgi:serine/threonine-protein kinase